MIKIALGVASGFLVGVLLVVALGGGREDPITVDRTITVISPTLTNGGTVIVTTAVPDLIGERLDVAKDRLLRAGFDSDVDGGGLFGIVEDSNWEVTTQDPAAGVQLEQGSTVHIHVEKR